MEGRITRARERDDDLEISRLARDDAPRPGPTVFKTISAGNYPTAARSYYAVQAVDVAGSESEGGAVGLAPGGNTLYAANVGSAVPPVGTFVIGHPVKAGRWAFRFG